MADPRVPIENPFKRTSRVPLKNPYLAVGLGLIFPGAGQLYQGRTFKGLLYAICIAGTFTYGMFLSEGTAIYANPSSSEGVRWGFIAQVPIGAPAVYAKLQQQRYNARSNVPQIGLAHEINAPFEGVLKIGGPDGAEISVGDAISDAIKEATEAALLAFHEGREITPESDGEHPTAELLAVNGQIDLIPDSSPLGPIVKGRFTGNLVVWNTQSKSFEKTDRTIELSLDSEVGRFEIDRKIYADRERPLRIDVVEKTEQGELKKIGVLRGTIPRPLSDRVAVPVEPEKLRRLHSDLGKTYDLAMVYTWIASLLNVLVLWDAFEGPAYGYGDETPEDDADSSKEKKSARTTNPAKPQPKEQASAT